MTYWDASALLKLYVTEPDSRALLDLAAEMESPMASSAIVTTEMLCALHRKEADGDLGKGSAEVVYAKLLSDISANRLLVLPFDLDVAAAAERVVRLAYERRPRVLLRSLDAIHLASAISVGAGQVVTADSRLREAASRAGLEVLPNRPY